jgi:hypothetical protein
MAATPYYAPDFKIQINGQDMPVAVRAAVTSVRLQDGMPSKRLDDPSEDITAAANRVEVELANTGLRWLQSHIRGLGFQPIPTAMRLGPVGTVGLASGLFDMDNKLSLALGYLPDPLVDMFTGEITGIEADFPDDGMPTLKLVAHDYLHRLAEGTYGRGFGPIPDFLIAAILSAENLLIPLIDPTVAAASGAMTILSAIFNGTGTKQVGQSDLQLLKQIADSYDADFWVEGNFLYLSRFLKEYAPRLIHAPRQHGWSGCRRCGQVHPARDSARFLGECGMGLQPRGVSRHGRTRRSGQCLGTVEVTCWPSAHAHQPPDPQPS